MKANRFDNILYFGVFLLTYLGYYAILLLMFNVGLSSASRSATIPIRLALAVFLSLLVVRNLKELQWLDSLKWFLLFSVFYITRLFLDHIQYKLYYIGVSEVLLYFLSFSFIPFVALNCICLTQKKIAMVFKALRLGGLVFSVSVVVYYGKFIGKVGRLATGTSGEEVLSPLALSYSSTLVIGVFAFYLLQNKTSLIKKISLWAGMALAIIPFFLGASRGALIALFVPFILYFFSGKSIGFRIRSILLLSFIVSGLVYLDLYLESGLLNRFLAIGEGIEKGSSSAERIWIWETSLSQFLDNPLMGDQLKVNNYQNYPHNIILEVLQTTGILGFVPFAVLLLKAWKAVFYILKHHKAYFWVPVIFIQAFFMNMFSGAIYTASWFWTSMGLLFSLVYFLKKQMVAKFYIKN